METITTATATAIKSIPILKYETNMVAEIVIHFQNGPSIGLAEQARITKCSRISVGWNADNTQLTVINYNLDGRATSRQIFPSSSIFQVYVGYVIE